MGFEMEDHSSSVARPDARDAKSRVEGSAHMPGPWVIDEAGIWSVGAGEIVAQTCAPDEFIHLPDDEFPHDVRATLYANARLIAAAPDLLAAARAALTFYDRADFPHMPGEVKVLDDLSAAIAKATSPADTASGQP